MCILLQAEEMFCLDVFSIHCYCSYLYLWALDSCMNFYEFYSLESQIISLGMRCHTLAEYDIYKMCKFLFQTGLFFLLCCHSLVLRGIKKRFKEVAVIFLLHYCIKSWHTHNEMWKRTIMQTIEMAK